MVCADVGVVDYRVWYTARDPAGPGVVSVTATVTQHIALKCIIIDISTDSINQMIH